MNLRPKNPQDDFLDIAIDTSRLRLVPIEGRHAADIFGTFSAEVTRFMVPKPAADISETEDFVRSCIDALKEKSDIQLAICDKKSGEFLGVCGLHVRGSCHEPELGIWVKADAHGHRFGFEAIEGLVGWASTNIDCSRFVYPVSKANIPSRKIAERLGGEVIKEREKQSMSGVTLEEVVYAIPTKP